MHLREETASKLYHDIMQNRTDCPNCGRLKYPSGLEISATLLIERQNYIGRVTYHCVECYKWWNNELSWEK